MRKFFNSGKLLELFGCTCVVLVMNMIGDYTFTHVVLMALSVAMVSVGSVKDFKKRYNINE